MANLTLPEPAIEDPKQDEERKRLALESSWEIEALAGLLLEKAASEEWGLKHDQAMILRSLGVRIKTLSSVVMSAIDDPVHETAALSRKVYGHV